MSVELPKIGVAAESDFDGITGAEVALEENVAAAREAAAATEGAEENRTALDVAHGADHQRAVLGHVAVEGHARAAGDSDVAAGAVRDRAEDVVDAVAEGQRRLVGQPGVEVEGCVLRGDHARTAAAGVSERAGGLELGLRCPGADDFDQGPNCSAGRYFGGRDSGRPRSARCRRTG